MNNLIMSNGEKEEFMNLTKGKKKTMYQRQRGIQTKLQKDEIHININIKFTVRKINLAFVRNSEIEIVKI